MSLTIDGTIEKLISNPTKSGKYEGIFVAPTKPGSYPISVSLKSVTGQEKSQPNVMTLIATPKPPTPPLRPPLSFSNALNTGATFQNVRVVTSGDRATFTFELLNPPDALMKFKIKYGDSPTTLTQEATTYTIDRIFKDGAYTWYIPKLAPKKWYFVIYGADIDGQTIPEVRSDLLNADLANGSCTIGNVSGISVENGRGKVILSW